VVQAHEASFEAGEWFGDQVDCVVLSVNPQERRISLGMRQLASNPWTPCIEISGGSHRGGTWCRNLQPISEHSSKIEDAIDGLVHSQQFELDQTGEASLRSAEKRRSRKAIVLAIEPDKRRLSLGVKQLQTRRNGRLSPATSRLATSARQSFARGKFRRVCGDRRGYRRTLS